MRQVERFISWSRNRAIDSAADPVILLPAATGKRGVILDIFITIAGATVITFRSGSTDISGPITYIGPGVFDRSEVHGVLRGNAVNEAISMVNTGAVSITGTVGYLYLNE